MNLLDSFIHEDGDLEDGDLEDVIRRYKESKALGKENRRPGSSSGKRRPWSGRPTSGRPASAKQGGSAVAPGGGGPLATKANAASKRPAAARPKKSSGAAQTNSDVGGAVVPVSPTAHAAVPLNNTGGAPGARPSSSTTAGGAFLFSTALANAKVSVKSSTEPKIAVEGVHHGAEATTSSEGGNRASATSEAAGTPGPRGPRMTSSSRCLAATGTPGPGPSTLPPPARPSSQAILGSAPSSTQGHGPPRPETDQEDDAAAPARVEDPLRGKDHDEDPRRPASAHRSAHNLPQTVSALLNLRKRSMVPLSEKSRTLLGESNKIGGGKTALQLAFQRQIETLAKVAGGGGGDGAMGGGMSSVMGNDLFDIQCFFDLRDYDLGDFEENKHERPPGSLRCLFLFYARLYEKLIAKQSGGDLPLFSNAFRDEFSDETVFPSRVDLGDRRCIGLREILDFSADFGLRPHRVGIRDLEQCYLAAHRHNGRQSTQQEAFGGFVGGGAAGAASANKGAGGSSTSFSEGVGGLTYGEFLQFLVFLSDVVDANSTKDKLCMRSPWLGRGARLKRFMTNVLQVQNVKKMKANLLDVWRRTHYWKIDSDEDLRKKAKILAQNCVPKQRIKPMFKDDSHRLGAGPQDSLGACVQYLERFTWSGDGPTWEAFPLPYLDMGTSRVGERKSFKITVTNKATHLLTLDVQPDGLAPAARGTNGRSGAGSSTLDGCSIRLPVPDEVSKTGLPMGGSCHLLVEPWPKAVGEFFGHLLVTGETRAGATAKMRVPIYMNFIMGGSNSKQEELNMQVQRHDHEHDEASQSLIGDLPLTYEPVPRPANTARPVKNRDFVAVAQQQVCPRGRGQQHHHHDQQQQQQNDGSLIFEQGGSRDTLSASVRHCGVSAGTRGNSKQAHDGAEVGGDHNNWSTTLQGGESLLGPSKEFSEHALPARKDSKPRRRNYRDPILEDDVDTSDEDEPERQGRNKRKPLKGSAGGASMGGSTVDVTRQLPHFAPKPFAVKGNVTLDLRSNHNLIPRVPRFYPGRTNL